MDDFQLFSYRLEMESIMCLLVLYLSKDICEDIMYWIHHNCSSFLLSQVSDQLQSRFSSGLSLPQICENFIKAAYDPRISGVYLHIEPLSCGWGKVEEIRRHILDFRKSGQE